MLLKESYWKLITKVENYNKQIIQILVENRRGKIYIRDDNGLDSNYKFIIN